VYGAGTGAYGVGTGICPSCFLLSFRNNIPRVTKITFGVFKFLFGVIEITFRETISIYNIGCQSPVPVAYKA